MSMVLAAGLAGCVLKAGPGPDSYEPARTATGIDASVATRSTSVKGELLDVRTNDLVILTTNHVVSVPLSAITLGVFEGSPVTIVNGQALMASERENIRLRSRFPQGIPDAALKRILSSKAQDSVVVIR